MPYVTSIGTHVPCHIAGLDVPVRLVTTSAHRPETDHGVSRRHRCDAQISLVHNVFRSTAVSALTAGEGATYGAG